MCCKVISTVKDLHNKIFLYFKDLQLVFGKDRANVVDIVASFEDMVESIVVETQADSIDCYIRRSYGNDNNFEGATCYSETQQTIASNEK